MKYWGLRPAMMGNDGLVCGALRAGYGPSGHLGTPDAPLPIPRPLHALTGRRPPSYPTLIPMIFIAQTTLAASAPSPSQTNLASLIAPSRWFFWTISRVSRVFIFPSSSVICSYLCVHVASCAACWIFTAVTWAWKSQNCL